MVEGAAELTDIFSEFARTLLTEFPLQPALDRLVVSITEVLPVEAAALTLITPAMQYQQVAASDQTSLRFERLQTDLGEGPSLLAAATGEILSVSDLRDDGRFAAFADEAIRAGVLGVFSFPLRHGNRALGALSLYRAVAGGLDAPATRTAQTLADVAAAYVLNAQARADLRTAAEHARQIALHDPLTGLPGRLLLVQHLDRVIHRPRQPPQVAAILLADIDHFKSINDTYGHQAGDELLVAVAQRLTGLLRPGDTLARLAGDEFVIVCDHNHDASQVEALALRIDTMLTEPFTLANTVTPIRTSASLGISFIREGEATPEQILRDADAAMVQAKGKGGAHHGVVDLREQDIASHRAGLSRDLRGAVDRGELRLEYQPIVAIADGRITGVEALLRWAHPTLGTIGPDVAVAVAEASGLITEIGGWVLERACLDLQRWQQKDSESKIEMAINVSAYQVMGPDLAATVAAVLADTHTDPAAVTLEMTESVFVRDSDRALTVLSDLKATGIRLALDDFGTGYSSLSYLKQFPVDLVKIDRSFVADLDHDPTSRLIVGAIVGLAHGLGMSVIAEGVETNEQFHEVSTLNCDAYQGFLFARPMPAAQIDRLTVDLAG